MAYFIPWLLLPQGPLAGRMSGSQSRFGKEKDLLLLSTIEICSQNNFFFFSIIALPTVLFGCQTDNRTAYITSLWFYTKLESVTCRPICCKKRDAV